MVKLSVFFFVVTSLFNIRLSQCEEESWPICHICPGGDYAMECPECLIETGVKEHITCAEVRDYGLNQQLSTSTCKILQQQANLNMGGCGCNTPVDVSVGKTNAVCEMCPNLKLGMPAENKNVVVRTRVFFDQTCQEIDNYGSRQFITPGTCEHFRSDGEACCEQPPTHLPTHEPTYTTTLRPTIRLTPQTTSSPTTEPTVSPTLYPTKSPTYPPTISPTFRPTKQPTFAPTSSPTPTPTDSPSSPPSFRPTKLPTFTPTSSPTLQLTDSLSYHPTLRPSLQEIQTPTTKVEQSSILRVTKKKSLISCSDRELVNSIDPAIIDYHYDLSFDPSSYTLHTASSFVESKLLESIAIRFGILPDGATCTNHSKPTGLSLSIVRVESLPQDELNNVFHLSDTPCLERDDMPAEYVCHTFHGKISVSANIGQKTIDLILNVIENQLNSNQLTAGTNMTTTWREVTTDQSDEQQQQERSPDKRGSRTTAWVAGVLVPLVAIFALAMVFLVKRRKLKAAFFSNSCTDKDGANSLLWGTAFINDNSLSNSDGGSIKEVNSLDENDSEYNACRPNMERDTDSEDESCSDSEYEFCTTIVDTTDSRKARSRKEILGLYRDSEIITATGAIDDKDDRQSEWGKEYENNTGLELQLEDISSDEWIH